MVTLMMRYPVRDFDQFKPVFDRYGEVRRRHGATGHRLYRTAEDPRVVTVLVAFPAADDAAAFLAEPGRPDVLREAGVDAAAQSFALLDPVEDVAY